MARNSILATCALALGLHLSAVAEELVPGVYAPVTDASGTMWTVQQNGILGKGADGLITGGMVLMVNNVQFYAAKPMMSVDTGAFVLANTQISIPVDVTRRVRVQSKEGFVRYLDTFKNPSALPTDPSDRTPVEPGWTVQRGLHRSWAEGRRRAREARNGSHRDPEECGAQGGSYHSIDFQGDGEAKGHHPK